MTQLTRCELTIFLEFAEVNGQTMQVEIKNCNQSTIFNPGKDTVVSYTTHLDLPAKIVIITSGKNMLVDTVVDENNNIIKDKHVKITSIQIDGIQIPYHWIERKIKLLSAEQQVESNYFGFNGYAELDFAKTNSFLQLLHFFKGV